MAMCHDVKPLDIVTPWCHWPCLNPSLINIAILHSLEITYMLARHMRFDERSTSSSRTFPFETGRKPLRSVWASGGDSEAYPRA
jgi:hypothetical protein